MYLHPREGAVAPRRLRDLQPRRLLLALFAPLLLLGAGIGAASANPRTSLRPEATLDGTSVGKEVPALRTAYATHFALGGGRYRAIFSQNENYEVAPGRWAPVDKEFRQSGNQWLMQETEFTARVDSQGITAVSYPSSDGIKWLTPEAPRVTGREVSYESGGLEWRYTVGTNGMKATARVDSRRASQTYAFPYQLLGNAKPLQLVPEGDLASGPLFRLARPFILGADRVHYEASAWRFTPTEVSFSFDDTSLPPSAFPYTIDPSTTFVVAGSEDDGSVYSVDGSPYPPPISYLRVSTGDLYNEASRFSSTLGRDQSVALSRWNSSSLPDNARLISATFKTLVGRSYTTVPPSPNLTADWYTAWPIDVADFTNTSGTSALLGHKMSDPLPSDADGEHLLTFDNTTGVSKTGYTGVRFHITGDNTNGGNTASFASFDNGYYRNDPALIVEYEGSDSDAVHDASEASNELPIGTGGTQTPSGSYSCLPAYNDCRIHWSYASTYYHFTGAVTSTYSQFRDPSNRAVAQWTGACCPDSPWHTHYNTGSANHVDVKPTSDASYLAEAYVVWDGNLNAVGGRANPHFVSMEIRVDKRDVDAGAFYTGTGTPPPGQYDAWSAFAEEWGHVQNLGHFGAPESTMSGTVLPAATTKRFLNATEILAACIPYQQIHNRC